MRRSHARTSRSPEAAHAVSKRSPGSSRPGGVDELQRLKKSIAYRVCSSVDTPRSLAVWLLVEHDEWEQYLELSFPDPLLSTFADDYLVSEMFTKDPTLPIDVNREAVALQRFDEAEELCAQTNRRFREYFAEPSRHYKELHRIFAVQSILDRALGPLGRDTLDVVESEFRFGPGATSSVSGRFVLPSRKYTSRLDVTPRLLPFANALKGRMSGVERLLSYSKVTTVPKNAKTDRTICVEPHLNVYYQLGVGKVLRSRLSRLGLKPNDQERNRFMAASAARNGYATIDLSMASDTIAFEVVSSLLPDDWLQLLYAGRTDFTMMPDGALRRLEKWSSMGNGYTWELESLIFYAIARSLTKKEIGVFGDDLVVPVEVVPDLLELLNLFGFKMNERKSFWQGPFRESCGTDWHYGVDVRPFYFKDEYEAHRPIWHYAISYANKLRVYSHRRGGRIYCDRRFLSAWLYSKRRATERVRTFCSLGYGDDGVIQNFDECTPQRYKSNRGWGTYGAVVARRPPVKSSYTHEFGAYLVALDRGSPGGITRLEEFCRRKVGKPRTEVIPVFDWYDLGPWL